MLHRLCKADIAAASASGALAACAATYDFDNTLASVEPGAPSLVVTARTRRRVNT